MARVAASRSARASALASLPGTIVALLRRLRTDLPVVATVAGVTLITAFVFAAIPLGFNRMADHGLQRAIADAPPYLRNFEATHADVIPASTNVDQTLDASSEKFQNSLASSVVNVISRREFVVDTPQFTIPDQPGQAPFPFPRFLTLRYQSNEQSYTTLIQGRWPAATQDTVPVTGSKTQTSAPVVEIALSPETAQTLGVKLNDTLLILPNSDDPLARSTPSSQLKYVAARIVGLMDVNNVKDDYWMGSPRVDQASVFDDGMRVRIYAYALFAQDAYPQVLPDLSPMRLNYSWRYFVDPTRFNAGNLDSLAREVRKLDAKYPASSFGRPTDVSMRTGLSAIFTTFIRQRNVAEAMLSLASIGLLAVAVTVIALVAGLSAERRRGTIAVVRSRGASAAQILLAQATESLALAVPCAIVGYLLALAFIAKRGSALAPIFALGIALVMALLSLAAALPLARRNLQQLERDDAHAVSARLSPRRVAAEAFIVAVALVGVYLIRRRGLSATSSTGEGGGFDPYLAAVPVLLGLATGVIVLRLFPLPVRFLAWLASLRRDLTPSLGLRRIARQPAVAALPLLVLLLAVAVATFSSVLVHSIETGQTHTAWVTVGADYRVDPLAGGSLYLGNADVPHVAGVQAVAQAYQVPNITLTSKTPTFGQLTFFAIEAANYASVTHGTPVDANFPTTLTRGPQGANLGSATNPIPVIVSSLWVEQDQPRPGSTFVIKLEGREVTFTVAQVRDSFVTVPSGTPFVIAPLEDMQVVFADRPLRPTNLYIRAPDSAQGALYTALGGDTSSVSLVSRAATYHKVHDAPLISGVASGFQIGLVLAAAYSLLAVVIALALTARSRARDLAYLRTLGLSEAQAIGLVAVELAPPVAVALAVGVFLGLGVARLIKQGLDLTAFTGPNVPVPLRVDWVAVLWIVVAVVVIVAGAVWAVGAAARRANLGGALRVGEER